MEPGFPAPAGFFPGIRRSGKDPEGAGGTTAGLAPRRRFAIPEAPTGPTGLPRRHLHKKSEKTTSEPVSTPAKGEKNRRGSSQTPEQHLRGKSSMRENVNCTAGGPIAKEMVVGPKDNSPEGSLRRHIKWLPGIGSVASLTEEDSRKSSLITPSDDCHRTVGIARPSSQLLSPCKVDSPELSQDRPPKTLFSPCPSTRGKMAQTWARGRGEPLAKPAPVEGQARERQLDASRSSEMSWQHPRVPHSRWQSETRVESSPRSEIQFSAFRKVPTFPSCKDRLLQDALELVDIEDEEPAEEAFSVPEPSAPTLLQVASRPIDLLLARDLKTLLFGSARGCFSEEWAIQSFAFNDSPRLKYGIVQRKGGPCGVLAAVQASVLGHLIFGDSGKSGDTGCLQPSDAHRTKCLSLALADILWRAGGNQKAVVTLHTEAQQFTPAGNYKADGILEMLMLHSVTKYEDLLMFLQQNIHQFEVGPHGCILLTLSAILSRSISQVRADFDVSTNRMIGAHGYCTQELVNLLLTGRAVSNVFNDTMALDSGSGEVTLLKGIAGRSDIGLLSLFEHYDVCKVGCYLKTPKLPIWLVCSESHFSVLFCLSKDLLGDWKAERRFDLLYYDGLANQQEEIRLTVDTSQLYVEDKEDDLIPPLEHCIRTKWKGAVVNWNGTEPIL